MKGLCGIWVIRDHNWVKARGKSYGEQGQKMDRAGWYAPTMWGSGEGFVFQEMEGT